MSKKLIPLVLIAILAAGGVYKFLLSGPAEATEKPKIDGAVYVLPKEFLVNLADDRYAKFTVALVLAELPEPHGEETPPEGYGAMPEEGIVRGIVTDVVGAATGRQLSSTRGRKRVRTKLLKELKTATDLEVHEVAFPDIVVQ